MLFVLYHKLTIGGDCGVVLLGPFQLLGELLLQKENTKIMVGALMKL